MNLRMIGCGVSMVCPRMSKQYVGAPNLARRRKEGSRRFHELSPSVWLGLTHWVIGIPTTYWSLSKARFSMTRIPRSRHVTEGWVDRTPEALARGILSHI